MSDSKKLWFYKSENKKKTNFNQEIEWMFIRDKKRLYLFLITHLGIVLFGMKALSYILTLKEQFVKEPFKNKKIEIWSKDLFWLQQIFFM